MPSHSDSWSQRIGDVFDIRPRIAVDDEKRWMKRAEEKPFRSSVVCPGVHTCLYGPSGSGKTSLAKTILGRLAKRGTKLIYTKLNHNSSWNSFKSQILENKAAKSASEKRLGVKIGIKNLLPYLEFDGEVLGGQLGSMVARRDIVEAIDISDIGQFIVDSNLVLAIDDANFADDTLLLTLANLAKYISDNSESSASKIVFIGADNIFARIISLENSLKDRTDEIALGSVRESMKSSDGVRKDLVWNFIASGLEILNLVDPRKDKFITPQQRKECIEWIYYAADGLPKSIVMAGKRIAELGEYRSRVSHSDILQCTKSMVRENYRQYRTQYRTLISLLREDEISQEICMWMFLRGASTIHTLNELAEDLNQVASYTMFDESLQLLESAGFLSITGANRDVFFAVDPLLAHTLGVVLNHPEKFGPDTIDVGHDPGITQMLLRFTGAKDPESRKNLKS